MKHILITILLIVVFGSTSFADYTATLQNVTASPDETVSVNLIVTGFSNVNSFQFFIQIDPSVLTFNPADPFCITNFAPGGIIPGLNGGNTVSLVWTNLTPFTITSGTLLTINFKYHGLTSPLTFTGLPEVYKFAGGQFIAIQGTTTSGSVSPYMLNTEQAHIGNVFAATGSSVSVPLWYTGTAETNADTIHQRIAYDATKLTFVSVTGSGLFNNSFTASAASGIITLHWAKGAGALLNAAGTRFNLNFTYTGSVTTNITFSTGCIIKAAPSGSHIAVTYNNGSVLLSGVASSFATLPALNTAVQGQTIDVPLNFSAMPAGITSFYLNLTYDNPRMTFVGVLSALYTVTSTSSGNTIALSYSNGSAPSINGQFLLLRFTYNGVGTANITFSGVCQFSNSSPIQVAFTNGTVTPAHVPGVDASIGYVSATSGSTADVPVTFTGFPSNIGQVKMYIAYDATRLTYLSLSANPHGAIPSLNGNIISVTWASGTPTDINTIPFVTLHFSYVAGSGSNCAGAVTFGDGCQVKTTAPETIVPANWNDGGVNVKFKISGTLQYNSDPNPRIPLEGFTVTLKSGSNSISTTTSEAVTGYFELLAPNGSYTIEATPKAGLPWFGDMDNVLAIFFYQNSVPLPNQNPLNALAGDVNQNGDMDLDDVVDVFFRCSAIILPDYTAPDWLFEIPSINVSCADVSNTNFLGLTSGDVLGINPTPNQ